MRYPIEYSADIPGTFEPIAVRDVFLSVEYVQK